MENLKVNIEKAKGLCEGSIKRQSYSTIYTFTTENISGYLKYFDLKNKNLLTIGSSGDQILNAYINGCRDITLYDINEFAPYYIYLKIASIYSLDYIEFQEFFFKHGLEKWHNDKMFSKETFNKIAPNLKAFDYDSFQFFNELFTSFSKAKIRDHLFDDDEARNKVIQGFNIYLKNENTYNYLKKEIRDISFNYMNGDIFKDKIPGTYDNIFLSNLCTTTSIETLKELVEKIDKNNLSINGSLLLGYLWNAKLETNEYEDDWKEIYKMPLVRESLKDYITEHHNIKDYRNFIWGSNTKEDLVLIYRKK